MDGIPSTRTPLRELQHIRLRADFEVVGGRIDAGTLGTILQVFDHGRAYQVEFEGPHDIPETVPDHLIVATHAAEPGTPLDPGRQAPRLPAGGLHPEE